METENKTQCEYCEKWYNKLDYCRCPELECIEREKREERERERKGYYGRVKTLMILLISLCFLE